MKLKAVDRPPMSRSEYDDWRFVLEDETGRRHHATVPFGVVLDYEVAQVFVLTQTGRELHVEGVEAAADPARQWRMFFGYLANEYFKRQRQVLAN